MKTIYIILSFCLGLFLGYVLFKTTLKPTVSIDDTDNQLTEINQLDAIRLFYEKKFNCYNDSITKELNAQGVVINKQKNKLIQSQQKVNHFIVLLKTDSSTTNTMLVDSLVVAFNDSKSETDTLIKSYEWKFKMYDTLIGIRNSQVIILNRCVKKLTDFSKDQVLREQQLTIDLNTTRKALNRKRNQNKILAGGMLFISGVATTLFIKSRQ
jgi:hypothetical protein